MKTGLIFIALLIGCVGSGDVVWGAAIFMGGSHFVRSQTDDVVAEGYLINTRGTPWDSRTFILGAVLLGSESDITPNKEVPSGRDWGPGEVRKWSATFSDSPREPQKLLVSVNAEPYWIYVSRCRDPQGVVVDEAKCPGIVQRPESSEETEDRFSEMLLECCEWVPPQLNINELECRVELSYVACTSQVINFKQSDIRVDAEAVLTEVAVMAGAGKREISRYELGSLTFVGDSTRTFDFDTSLEPLPLIEAGHTYSMELRLSNSVVPRSIANETSLIIIAQTPDE